MTTTPCREHLRHCYTEWKRVGVQRETCGRCGAINPYWRKPRLWQKEGATMTTEIESSPGFDDTYFRAADHVHRTDVQAALTEFARFCAAPSGAYSRDPAEHMRNVLEEIHQRAVCVIALTERSRINDNQA